MKTMTALRGPCVGVTHGVLSRGVTFVRGLESGVVAGSNGVVGGGSDKLILRVGDVLL